VRLLELTKLDLASVRGRKVRGLSGANVRRMEEEEGGERDEYDYPLRDYRNEKIS